MFPADITHRGTAKFAVQTQLPFAPLTAPTWRSGRSHSTVRVASADDAHQAQDVHSVIRSVIW